MEEKMRFACLVEKGHAEVRERAIPALGDHDVLIKQVACNICTTDYGQWLGLREHQGYPMVGGHEGCGYVQEVGKEVKNCKVGDFVGVNCYTRCGTCEHCLQGEFTLCENAPKLVTEDGYLGEFGFSTHAIWPESSIVQLNPELDPAVANFLEPLATVLKGLDKLRLKRLETVVVIGGGTMGILNALAARAYGARVIVSELIDKKLACAKAYGFETIDSGKEDPIERIKELTNGRGADCVIVAVGVAKANEQAISMLKGVDGRVLQFAAGYPVPKTELNWNEVHYRRLEIIGTFGCDVVDYANSAKMLNMKLIDPSKLVESERFPLTRMQDAFAAAATPGMYRVCVECQK